MKLLTSGICQHPERYVGQVFRHPVSGVLWKIINYYPARTDDQYRLWSLPYDEMPPSYSGDSGGVLYVGGYRDPCRSGYYAMSLDRAPLSGGPLPKGYKAAVAVLAAALGK